MKILLVSWSILPQVGGSSIIIENLAQNFDRSELTVFGSTPLFRNNRVKREPTAPEFIYFFSEMYLFGRGYRYFEWFRKRRFHLLIKEIKAVVKARKIDRIIGVYPNPYYCLAACRAAKSLNIPFFAYFHNTYLENKAIADPEAGKIQEEIFDQASVIFVMSPGMQKFYRRKYVSCREKFIPLVHTFNKYPEPRGAIPGQNKSQYRLVAIGNFNESNLEATRRFVDAVKRHPRYRLSLFTHVPKLLLQNRGLDVSGFTHCGFVHPDQVHDTLQHYDICLLTHGFNGSYGEVEYQTIFPTRTIPLLLSGKPIFAHSPPGAYLNEFISETQCAELVEEASEAAIIRGLDKIAGDAGYQKQLTGAARRAAGKFYGPNVAKQLREILSE